MDQQEHTSAMYKKMGDTSQKAEELRAQARQLGVKLQKKMLSTDASQMLAFGDEDID